MKTPVKISFGKSSSSQFARAVRLAASLPGYLVQGEGRQVSHQVALEVSLNDASWETLKRLLQLIAGWRSTSIEIDGKAISPGKLLRSVEPIKYCYARKLKHEVGDHYCSGKDSPT